MKRRAILTMMPGALAATAVPGIAAAARQVEPRSDLLDLYRKWCEAKATADHLAASRSYTDNETRAEQAAQRRSEKLRVQLMGCQPETMPEVAAMLHVLWDTLGWQPDEPDTFWNGGAPSLLSAIWRGASGREGVPVSA